MAKNIIRVTAKRKEAIAEKNSINRDFSRRNIKRIAYVTPVSQGYVRTLTRKGYPIPKKNYAIAVKNK